MKHKFYNVVFVLCCLLPFVGYAQKIGAYSDAVKAVASWKPPVLQSVSADGAASVQVGEEPKAVEFLQKLNALNTAMKVEKFEKVSPKTDVFSSLRPEKLTLSTQPATVQKIARAAEAVTVKAGSYVSKDNSKYYGERNRFMELVQETVEEKTVWKMKGVYGVDGEEFPVVVDFDAATGGVSIAPQKIGESSTYGDVYIYKIDLEANKYYPTDPITGTIDDKGVITLGGWAVMADANGEKAGSIFDAYYSSSWVPTNATIKITDDEGTETSHASLVEQKYDNEIVIHNFAGNGVSVTATLTSAKTVKISSQTILTNILYGDFCLYPVDLENKVIDPKSPILGTGTESTITLGSWVVGARSNPSSVALIAASTEITTTLKIRYPEALTVKFDGEGTEASPYLIKTASDLQMLSQSVSDGEPYKGKFFKVTQNIDMSSLTISWIPVGDVSATFEGTFDGDGKTISNLKVDRKGFNYGGLFGFLGSSAVVKNLKLTDVSVAGSGEGNGAVAGYNKGLIENCSVDGVVNTTGNITGGIVGASEGTLKDCSFSGSVAGCGSVGGLAGNSYGKIVSCHAIGSVTLSGLVTTLDTDAGGLVGEAYSTKTAESEISDSYFAGVLADEKGLGYTGGLVGLCVNTKIDRCFNTGIINAATGSSDTGSGGLVGYGSSLVVNDSFNSGTIMRSGNTEGAGGLAGYLSVIYSHNPGASEPVVENASQFNNCYNSGMVSSSSVKVDKGLYGHTFESYGINPAPDMFKNCWFDTQMNGLKNQQFGKPTSFFTSGQLPEGFDSQTWKAEAGYYPVLLSSENAVPTAVAKSSLQLSNGETIKKVKSESTLNAPAGVTWKLYSSEGYVDETPGLKISGNKVSVKDQYSTELLVAMASDGSAMKAYQLAAVPKVFDGDGTAESPYLIKDKADFIKLHEAVQTHGQAHEDDFFKMTNDIDFALADDFQGVGGKNGKNPFEGTFDGDGHYIHNLKIHAATYDDKGKADFELGSYYYAGLFNVCGPASVIKNVNIAADCSFDFWAQSAPIAGYTNGRIENCRNYADVNGVYTQFAGIAGVADSTAVISRCYNAGNIVAGSYIAGGIVGMNLGLIELCQNDGDVAAKFYNALYKEGTQSVAGGIVGQSYGSIDRSLNNGDVSTYKTVGGIVGTLGSFKIKPDLTNCVNTGFVNCLAVDLKRGGIAGNLYNKNVVANNYYDASINSNGGADNAAVEGITGLSTSKLVSGDALDGLSREDWVFAKGIYPGLVDYAYEDASVALRSTWVKFADGESRNNFVTSAETSNKTALKWTLTESENFKLEGTKLSLAAPADMALAKATLTAVYGEKYTKVYDLMSIPQNLFDGKGTAADPYQIKTKDDMYRLADFVNTSGMEYEGYYFKLMNDLDYEEGELKPIATGTVNFNGDFDGDGKTISNFKFEKEKYVYDDQNIALFGSLGTAGVVHDLTVNGTLNGYRYVAGFAGKLYGKLINVVNKGSISVDGTYGGGLAAYAYSGSEIRDSHNEGSVTTNGAYAGGIVAKMDDGLIDNCYNTGTVSTVDNKNNTIGGIVADLNGGTITNCYNSAEMLGKSTVGGIVADASKDWRIENCYNTANITGTGGSSIGGILGMSSNATNCVFKNNYNTGTITGTSDTGGVAGKVGRGTTMEDSYNTGNVITNKSTNTGGFVGRINGSSEAYSKVIRCWNSGDVIGIGNCTAGFIGQIYDEEITLEDCYNLGDVYAENPNPDKQILGIGGFAGDLSGHAIRCWNAGNVTSNGYGIGGMSGYASGTIEYCFNLGDITALSGENKGYGSAGGLWGYGKSTIRNCYNMGTVTGVSDIAGINGQNWGGAIENCYNAGKVVVTGEDKTAGANVAIVKYPEDSSIANNYYDKEVAAAEFENDKDIATGLTSKELFGKTELGEGFAFNRAAYPTVAGLLENRRANLAAASVEFAKEGDNLQNVTDKFFVGMLENVVWTCSDNLQIAEDGTVTSASKGEAWVKATVNLDDEKVLEKTINLTINVATGGVEDTFAGKAVVAKVYYDFAGVEVAVPQPGSLYIVKSVYDDGSASVAKEYYKEK